MLEETVFFTAVEGLECHCASRVSDRNDPTFLMGCMSSAILSVLNN